MEASERLVVIRRTGKTDVDSLTLKDAMNYFLSDRLSKVERGELVERTLVD